MDTGQGKSRRRLPGVVTVALAFLAGVVAVQGLTALPPWWLDAALAVLALAVMWRLPRWRWLAVLLLGFVWCAWRADGAMHARLPRHLEKADIDVVATVHGLPRRGEVANRFRVFVSHASLDGEPLDWHGNTRLSWYGAPDGAPAPCSRWHLRIRPKRPRTLANPGGWDSERGALVRRQTASGYVRSQGDNRKLGDAFWCLDRWRAEVSAAIGRAVPQARDAHLLQALAVGDKRGLSDADRDVARANGISHLLAISGFHVGIAALFGAWLVCVPWWLIPALGRLVPRQVAQGGGAFATALAYSAMAGFGLPTVRSLVMISVVALVVCLRRTTSGVQTLLAALLVVLLWDPLTVLSAGFWLSFGGVAFLLLGLAQPRSFLGHIRAMGSTQLLMTVAFLPLTIWFFGRASILGVVSNLVAVPVVSLAVVPLTLAGTLALPLSGTLAAWLWQAGGWILHWLWQLMLLTAHWPGGHWFPPAVTLPAVALALLGTVWLFLPRGLPARGLGLVLFLPLLLPPQPQLAEGAFRMWVIDVGQGLSVLVRTREHALVYDTGARYPSGFDMGQAAVLPLMHTLGVNRLDVLMISHGDNDHAGGAQSVASAFPEARRLSGEPARVEPHMAPCHAGQSWSWDGVQFSVIHPDTHGTDPGDNDKSCVLLLEGAGGRALLTGDITRAAEPEIAERTGDGKPLVLQVPHHGSKSSSGKEFLRAIDPQIAIASAGWLNRYHHPADAVVARYRRQGVRFLNTADTGAVEVRFPVGAAPWVATRWRLHADHYWREHGGQPP